MVVGARATVEGVSNFKFSNRFCILGLLENHISLDELYEAILFFIFHELKKKKKINI